MKLNLKSTVTQCHSKAHHNKVSGSHSKCHHHTLFNMQTISYLHYRSKQRLGIKLAAVLWIQSSSHSQRTALSTVISDRNIWCEKWHKRLYDLIPQTDLTPKSCILYEVGCTRREATSSCTLHLTALSNDNIISQSSSELLSSISMKQSREPFKPLLWRRLLRPNCSVVCYKLYVESLDRSPVVSHSAFNSESLQHTAQPGMV